MKKIITDDYEFVHIIGGKAAYVDKTDLLARMASGRDGTQFCMSRPHRFGKSLMRTTSSASSSTPIFATSPSPKSSRCEL